MALSERDRVRFARHLLLPELGTSGQERLLLAELRAAANADSEAREVARDYVERAGLTVTEGAAQTLALPTREQVEKHAGAPHLTHAASALLGALSAVEAIKSAAEIGQKAAHEAWSFVLSSEEA